MRTKTFIASLALIFGLAFVGCGYDLPGHEIIDDDFEAGNLLSVTSITANGSYAPELDALDINDDFAVIGLANETRLGVDEGVDLHVFRVDVTYYDNNGNSRDFAPRQSYDVTQVVPADGASSLEIVLIPADMKLNGLRDTLLTGTLAERNAVSQWTVVVVVYARDIKNDDKVHAQGGITVRFNDPVSEGAAQ